jgi:hypothetical protein
VLFSQLAISYDHDYSGTGSITSAVETIQWDPEESSASESGHARYSVLFWTLGTPQQAPAEPATDPDDPPPDNGDTDPEGSGESDDEAASPLPELTWTYSGLYQSDSSFLQESPPCLKMSPH